MPDVAVTPSEHFNSVAYSGNDADDRSISVGFQPDWVWLKGRSNATNHYLYDVLRGANYQLLTNDTGAEANTADRMQAFESNGFQLGTSNEVNGSGRTYVSWNWKANGSGSSNTNGSINTTATSANVDAGFSISTYTGTGSNATIGHGLSKAPEMVIVKARSGNASHWLIYHKGIASDAETDYLYFNTNAAADYALYWNDTAPTSTVFSIGTDGSTNGSSINYVAYCFHSVDGYSKVGSYTGNGNADGTFVYTGHRPAVILLKRTDSADGWVMLDNERVGYNGGNNVLEANDSAAEDSSVADRVDILSNGFKLRNSWSKINASSGNYIFISFAETPFKNSNGR